MAHRYSGKRWEHVREQQWCDVLILCREAWSPAGTSLAQRLRLPELLGRDVRRRVAHIAPMQNTRTTQRRGLRNTTNLCTIQHGRQDLIVRQRRARLSTARMR